MNHHKLISVPTIVQPSYNSLFTASFELLKQELCHRLQSKKQCKDSVSIYITPSLPTANLVSHIHLDLSSGLTTTSLSQKSSHRIDTTPNMVIKKPLYSNDPVKTIIEFPLLNLVVDGYQDPYHHSLSLSGQGSWVWHHNNERIEVSGTWKKCGDLCQLPRETSGVFHPDSTEPFFYYLSGKNAIVSKQRDEHLKITYGTLSLENNELVFKGETRLEHYKHNFLQKRLFRNNDLANSPFGHAMFFKSENFKFPVTIFGTWSSCGKFLNNAYIPNQIQAETCNVVSYNPIFSGRGTLITPHGRIFGKWENNDFIS